MQSFFDYAFVSAEFYFDRVKFFYFEDFKPRVHKALHAYQYNGGAHGNKNVLRSHGSNVDVTTIINYLFRQYLKSNSKGEIFSCLQTKTI